MSKYCGKCDLYDWFFIRDDPIEEQLSKSKIYCKDELLKVKTEMDLALFFPYIVGTGYGDGNGKSIIHIGENDYIREMELQRINTYVRDATSEKKRCKRNKLEYEPENVYKTRFSWMFSETDKEQVMEIISRVGEGGRQSYDDIRLGSVDYWRNVWLNDLVQKYGYDERLARKWIWHLA